MDKTAVLNLVRLPARLDTQQAALILGFNDHDVPVLIRARLLKTLGSPAPNAPKYFASCEIEKLASDPDWLNRATKAISSRWREKNENRDASRNAAPSNVR